MKKLLGIIMITLSLVGCGNRTAVNSGTESPSKNSLIEFYLKNEKVVVEGVAVEKKDIKYDTFFSVIDCNGDEVALFSFKDVRYYKILREE